ncbi:hypothetical protein KIPB_007420, partial [Kipferlia bialata]
RICVSTAAPPLCIGHNRMLVIDHNKKKVEICSVLSDNTVKREKVPTPHPWFKSLYAGSCLCIGGTVIVHSNNTAARKELQFLSLDTLTWSSVTLEAEDPDTEPDYYRVMWALDGCLFFISHKEWPALGHER